MNRHSPKRLTLVEPQPYLEMSELGGSILAIGRLYIPKQKKGGGLPLSWNHLFKSSPPPKGHLGKEGLRKPAAKLSLLLQRNPPVCYPLSKVQKCQMVKHYMLSVKQVQLGLAKLKWAPSRTQQQRPREGLSSRARVTRSCFKKRGKTAALWRTGTVNSVGSNQSIPSMSISACS